MTERYQEISFSIESKETQEEAFACFMQAYLAFETYRKQIEKIFLYIQLKFDLNRQNQMLSIEKLLVSLWLEIVIQPNLPRILIGVKAEVTKIRELDPQEKLIADFICFMSSYSQDPELPQCATICEYIVQFYEEELETFLVALASTKKLTAELDVTKCKLIISAWNEEMEQAKRLFGKSRNLMRKCKMTLRKHLLEPSISSIEGIIADSLRSPQTDRSLINKIYKIYSAYKVLNPRLVRLFEQVFRERVTSKPVTVSDMSYIVECTRWADSLLTDCFEDNKFYTLKLDRVVFSNNQSTFTSILAERIDKIIRTQSALTENSSEHRELFALMAQLRFVEDKETFCANYSHLLALRLMTWRQQASDALFERIDIEKRMIKFLGKMWDSAFVERLNRMLADVEKEKENSKNLLPAEMSSDAQMMILTGVSWPQAKSGWKEGIWPEKLEKIYSVAASNYKERNSSRKLEWLPELSTVTVKMGRSLATLSMVQYSFLFLLIQKGSRVSKPDCWTYFDLTEEALDSLIKGLMTCDLVQTDGNDYYIDETALDSFPPRIDLAFAVRKRVASKYQLSPSEIGALNQPIDYGALIQCHLVRISKREGMEGRLLKTLLFQKTKDALSSRISLLDAQLETQLKILIEKRYLKVDWKGKYIKYCP